jgi:hypothetical protein
MTSNRDRKRFVVSQTDVEDSDATVIDAEVIGEEEWPQLPAHERGIDFVSLEVAIAPTSSAEVAVIEEPPPFADRLLNDALNRRWLPFDKRVAGVAATVATLEALYGNTPVGEDRNFDWPTCPSYAELVEHPIDGAVPTPLGT